MRLAEEGADIIALDICDQIESVGAPMSTKADLEETVSLVRGAGRRISAHQTDTRDRDAVQRAVDAGVDELGRLDFVLANAGILPNVGEIANSMQAWQDTIDVILTGTLNTLDATFPRLIAQGTGGSIVITGSMAAVQPMMRTVDGRKLGVLGYSAAKAGLVSLTENYASILAEHRVRVNIVHPTGVNTPMIANPLSDEFRKDKAEADLQVLINAIPGVPAVEPEDITSMVLFLCSDEARYLTGSAFRVDAGASLR
jgi:NAD(P)-dependent dehydrogenase (short-subunit alcohol dehydrogenase family)